MVCDIVVLQSILLGSINMLYKLPLNEIRLHILGRTNENPPWRHNGRKTEYNHLLIIIDGTCNLSIENKTYILKAQDFAFIPSKKFYILKTSTHCEYFFACFYPDYEDANENDLKTCQTVFTLPEKKFFLAADDISDKIICLPDYMRLNDKSYSDIATLFIKIQQLNLTGKYIDRLLIDVYFNELLLLLSNLILDNVQPQFPQMLKKIMLYIDKNYTCVLSSKTLSNIFNLSQEHICNLFLKNLNMSVSEYINSVKLKHAVELLSNSSMNITQIADYLGFSSIHYFSRVFKKQYGISPTKFSSDKF